MSNSCIDAFLNLSQGSAIVMFSWIAWFIVYFLKVFDFEDFMLRVIKRYVSNLGSFHSSLKTPYI